MWQTITMAILHVIRRNITETALWSECVKAKSTVPHCDSFLILNIFERHWSYSDRSRRVRLEVKDFSLLRLWKKRFKSNNKWKVKKIKGMCANSLGALYIYRCVLFCELKEDNEERNPCIWDVVVWCCLSATVADSGSRFALVAVRLRGFIGDCLHLRRSFLYLCLWRFAFVIYDGFSTGGKRQEKIISSAFQSSVWLLPPFILFLRISSPKNESSVMIYLSSCSTKPVWVSLVEQKR